MDSLIESNTYQSNPMYARNLSLLLHQQLSKICRFEDTLKRFEKLRGYGLLPRGRENAGVRLSDKQIASAVLGYTPTRPGWAGHVALILGNLRPVGGQSASFNGTETLVQSVAELIKNEAACNCIIHVTLSIAHLPTDDEYHAQLVFEDGKERRSISYVSKMAYTLLQKGAEKTYDSERSLAPSTSQLVLGKEFFWNLRRTVALSHHLDKPFETDWREYKTEEKLKSFHRRLGARRGSNFLNLGIDTQVTWPKEPTRIEFADHHFVLFPKTKEYSHSISVDLASEHLTAHDARTLINRFLSILSWCDDQHAILREGWSGGPVPSPVPRHDLAFATAIHWDFGRSLPEDKDLLQRLAYFREGLNAREAGIASYEVLAFFKVFENREKVSRGEINHTKCWIVDVFDEACRSVGEDVMQQFDHDRQSKSVEKYVNDNCRVAAAHASKDFPSDADASPELRRLIVAAEVMHALARHFLRNEFSLSDSYLTDEIPTAEKGHK